MLLLGVSGRKQSGKTTVGNFILSLYLAKLGYSEKIYMDEEGQLLISDLLGDTSYEGVFDVKKITNNNNNSTIQNALNKLNSKVKVYSFADILKMDICIRLFGLTYDQCYGNDDAKNTLTELRWEDMPGVLTPEKFSEFTKCVRTPLNSNTLKDTILWSLLLDPAGPKNGFWTSVIDSYGIIVHEPGFMTAREVMQYVGTDIFRKMYSNIWIRSTINEIIKEQPELAIITDCRFPNEVESIKKAGGKVIRLTRNPFNSDHISETILDKEKYDWSNFDYILHNDNISLLDQFTQIKTLLEEILPL